MRGLQPDAHNLMKYTNLKYKILVSLYRVHFSTNQSTNHERQRDFTSLDKDVGFPFEQAPISIYRYPRNTPIPHPDSLCVRLVDHQTTGPPHPHPQPPNPTPTPTPDTVGPIIDEVKSDF